jgi:hypothetical protein
MHIRDVLVLFLCQLQLAVRVPGVHNQSETARSLLLGGFQKGRQTEEEKKREQRGVRVWVAGGGKTGK